MRDITLSELQRLRPNISEADDTLQMDQDIFCSLYERTARPLWVYLWRKTGDSQLADDLLQETYYRFLRTRVAFESDKHRKNYLFRIATNLARDSRRHQKDHEQLSEDDERVSFQADPEIVERSERRRDLERAMEQLKPRQRDALWLAYAEGSSHEEIAAVLGMKVQSVKLVLFRARRKLAGLLRGGAR
jgi:RNA polymerase sigma-70 factor (ECF subfamily)